MRATTLLLALLIPSGALAQDPAFPLPIEFRNSAEFRWLAKPVLASRVLDDTSEPARWTFTGTGTLTRVAARGAHALRVDMHMYVDSPAPNRGRLSSVNLRRNFEGEDWSGFNRISLWIRPELGGFPMLPLQIVLHNDGAVKVPDAYAREGTHFVTLKNGAWQQVVWEIEPLARDRVTALEIGYWVNKMLADPGDRVAFEIADVQLQRVAADHVEGWRVGPGTIAYSHPGYLPAGEKSALATDLPARSFQVLKVDGSVQGETVLTDSVRTVSTRYGTFQLLDFSALRAPGSYVLQAGPVRTAPFRIGDDAWQSSIWKAVSFFFGERCGHPVEGSHGVCHADWTATRGEQKIVMNGGWHDAGDLSQSGLNTAEATYSLFALAERLQRTGEDPRLLAAVVAEAKWGLDWLLRVRFPGGYRIHFASNNLWTDGIIGTADDRSRATRNNPTVNYLAATAEALAYRVLRSSGDSALAERSLRIAREDWEHALTGIESAETRDTPAFATGVMELASIGILASLELYQATGEARYAEKAVSLAETVLASQQRTFVGDSFPLAGFFYTGPDRDTIFHQFHRGNDQAPIVALARLVELLPGHADWMRWYGAVVRYAEYQKRGAAATAPYEVLPAYVYHENEHLQLPDTVGLHRATRAAFREQVLRGLPLGGGFYLRAFPVWFARRGNFGVLLSQAKALSTAALLRGDSAAFALAQRQAQWIVGRNPFGQSTMYGEGHDWSQQYSVSSGDFVGALPVGIQTRGNDDAPYWPAANMYVYKEVWVHPVSRWLWLMTDLAAPPTAAGTAADPQLEVASGTAADGTVTLRVTARGRGPHVFSLRTENLRGPAPARTLTLREGVAETFTWQLRLADRAAPWVAVVIPDDDVTRRRDAYGFAPARRP